MKVETETIKNEVFMNEEGTHRYLLQRKWGEPNTAIVAVITLKPGSTSPLHNDLTTILIQNHVAINLVSGISLSNKVTEKLSDKEIEDEVLKEVLNKKEVQQVIAACGSSISKKGFPQDRLKEILNLPTKTNKEKVVQEKLSKWDELLESSPEMFEEL